MKNRMQKEEHFNMKINKNFEEISQLNLEKSQWSRLKPR